MLPSRTITMAMPVLSVQTVDQKLAALDERLTALEKLLSAQKDGSVTIKATKLVLDAITVEVRAAQSVAIQSGSSVDLKSCSVTLKSLGNLDIEASAKTSVRGTLLVLNNGGNFVARLGDKVSPAGVIMTASQTIMA